MTIQTTKTEISLLRMRVNLTGKRTFSFKKKQRKRKVLQSERP